MKPDVNLYKKMGYGAPTKYPPTDRTWWIGVPREQFTKICVDKIPWYLQSPRGHDKYVAIYADRLPASKPKRSSAEVDPIA
jgi:hypothetical protein